MGRPDRIIVSSFYEGGVRDRRIRFVGPILRPAVLHRRAKRGEHLLVYFNRGAWQLVPRIEAALRALRIPVVVYGSDRRGDDGALSFRPPSNDVFLDDLAGCRAVFSTAGNQLVGEAVWFGKPMLVMPENTVEQRLNAAAVERLGIGRAVDHHAIDVGVLGEFLGAGESLRETMKHSVRDGRTEAVGAIEGFARELRSASKWPAPRALEPA
jgi:uncharacterized protein (TIGR00661 family)